MLSEAFLLSIIGITFVFLFLALLVLALQLMSFLAGRITGSAIATEAATPQRAHHSITQTRQRAALAATSAHHHRVNAGK